MPNYISLDDIFTVEVEGTTNSTANTQSFFRHAAERIPRAWFPMFGDVYIPEGGWDFKDVDVRSDKTSERFKIRLLF